MKRPSIDGVEVVTPALPKGVDLCGNNMMKIAAARIADMEKHLLKVQKTCEDRIREMNTQISNLERSLKAEKEENKKISDLLGVEQIKLSKAEERIHELECDLESASCWERQQDMLKMALELAHKMKDHSLAYAPNGDIVWTGDADDSDT